PHPASPASSAVPIALPSRPTATLPAGAPGPRRAPYRARAGAEGGPERRAASAQRHERLLRLGAQLARQLVERAVLQALRLAVLHARGRPALNRARSAQ